MHRPQIKIFLAEGTPTGLRTAELGLSTCKAVVAPRSGLPALQARPEAKRTGVYILVGPDAKHVGRDAVYVGEGDNVFKRIAAHDKDPEKEFWDLVVLFVSKDDNLTKAHVRELEGRLIKLAREAKQATVVNATSPEGGQLPEADLAEMDELLEHIRLLLGTLGIHAFHVAPSTRSPDEPSPAGTQPVEFEISGTGYLARCLFQDGTFTVLAGGLARVSEAPSLSDWAKSSRKALLDNGVLEAAGEHYKFTQNYAFSSASGAAGVVSGTTVNGKIAWHLLPPDGRSFKEWEESMLALDETSEEES